MGRGDMKTKRGKISRGSFGVVRPKKSRKIKGSTKSNKK
jgi:30S ribosomal protein S31